MSGRTSGVRPRGSGQKLKAAPLLHKMRSFLRRVFAGDSRVWKAAAIVGLPLILLIAGWCLVPRHYLIGTNSVDTITYVAPTPAGKAMCVSGLTVPAGTARIQLDALSRTPIRPALHMQLSIGGRQVQSSLPATSIGPSLKSSPSFDIPQTPSEPAAQSASSCIRAGDLINWGGVTVDQPGFPPTPTVAGASIGLARVTVRYLPQAGVKRSYVGELGDILSRASLFRPGFAGPLLYVVMLFALLPVLALAAVRLIALALAGEQRRFAVWLFSICALNAMCWALITPAFHLPDEVDHFAYVESLATHLRSPEDPSAPRWPSSETDAIDATHFLENHYNSSSRAPWLQSDVDAYNRLVKGGHPEDGDGGGITTASTHGPIYYLALTPAILIAGAGHVFAQLTLARLISALIGAIVAVCTYLMCLEFAPRQRWLAVVAALLVSYEPMFGFISGGVNNDVGVNAGAAVVELLLLRVLTRGLSLRRAVLAGAMLALLPYVKATGYSLWAVAALVFAFSLGRELVQTRRARDDGWVRMIVPWAAFALTLFVVRLALTRSTAALNGNGVLGGGTAVSSNPGLAHLTSFASYLWQTLLPKLPFMTSHFVNTGYPFKVIFAERGFAAFGFYTVYFPAGLGLYTGIMLLMYAISIAGVVAAWRERAYVRRNLWPLLALVLMPAAVVAGFVSEFYTPGARNFVAEFGRYAFPAIGPLAIIVLGSLYAFGRRAVPWLGTGLVALMIGFSYASQLLTLTTFYA